MSRIRSRTQGDDGVALFAALAVVGITSALALVILGYSVTSARDSAVDRGRSVAVASVEGVVDSTYAALQTSAPGNLPCSYAPPGVLAAGPDGAAAEAQVRYVKADGTYFTATPAACLPSGYLPADVTGALITVEGSTVARDGVRSSRRTMESLVKLTPVYAQTNTLGKAIYASGSLSFSNNSTILGNVGNDADVYAGSVMNCNNSLSLGGSLYVQGPTTFSNSCSIKGDLHSLGSVQINNNSTIGGRVISSTGSVALNHPGIGVGGVVQAAGNITGQGSWGSCTTPKCQKNLNPKPPAPPSEPFPILQWDAATQADWAAQGFTNVVTKNDCTDVGGINVATKWFIDNASTLPAKTVLVTNCEIRLQNNYGKDLKLNNDLMIVSKGGFVTANKTTFGSTVPGVTRNLYWVIPYDTASRPCTSPQLSTDNQFGLTDDVLMFLYSPCDIRFSNQSTHVGQIYGGSNVQVNNKFTLQFRPVPVYGVQMPTSLSTTVESYKVDIVYKRETV